MTIKLIKFYSKQVVVKQHERRLSASVKMRHLQYRTLLALVSNVEQ